MKDFKINQILRAGLFCRQREIASMGQCVTGLLEFACSIRIMFACTEMVRSKPVLNRPIDSQSLLLVLKNSVP